MDSMSKAVTDHRAIERPAMVTCSHDVGRGASVEIGSTPTRPVRAGMAMDVDARLEALLRGGFLACLDGAQQRALLDAGHLIELVAGQPLGPRGADGAGMMMLAGLLRLSFSSPLGRPGDPRCARPGGAG